MRVCVRSGPDLRMVTTYTNVVTEPLIAIKIVQTSVMIMTCCFILRIIPDDTLPPSGLSRHACHHGTIPRDLHDKAPGTSESGRSGLTIIIIRVTGVSADARYLLGVP